MDRTTQNDFEQRYSLLVKLVDNSIERYLKQDCRVPDVLRDAMLYSLRAGGKRLRPIMVILACQACGGCENDALAAATAMEIVHTYSLIHDDLPAMDDDDFRRGKPTNHKVFGEAIAILAGDALLTYAFNILAMHVPDDKIARQLVLELAHAAGASGMIGGQAADITSENTQGDLETVKYIHTCKTAMMFRGAVRIGALCAGSDARMVEMTGDFGLKLGLAFQIADDMLDVTATSEEMGKQTQKDAQAGKLTYPSIVGMEESRKQTEKLVSQAISAIEPLEAAGEPLRQLAKMLVNRRK